MNGEFPDVLFLLLEVTLGNVEHSDVHSMLQPSEPCRLKSMLMEADMGLEIN